MQDDVEVEDWREEDEWITRWVIDDKCSLEKWLALYGVAHKGSLGQEPVKKIKRKRPEPREGIPEHQIPFLRWRHAEEGAANWLKLLGDPKTYDPLTYAYRKFRRKFRVPRQIFDELHAEAALSKLFSNEKTCARDNRGPEGACALGFAPEALGGTTYLGYGRDVRECGGAVCLG